MSTAICFSLTFALILINAIMGIFIGLNYYFTMACLLTACLSLGLVLLDSKRIFSKQKKAINRIQSNKVVRRTRQPSSNSRRKIS